MGKNFTTSIPTYVEDKMFQLPAELMQTAIEKTDKGIDEELERVDVAGGLLDIQNIKSDNPQVNARLKYYKDKLSGITSTINKSPLDYRKHRNTITTLSKELDNDLQRGLLGNAQDNFNKLEAELKKIDSLPASVSQERRQAYKDMIKAQYEARGSLNQQGDQYQDISELFTNPLEEFDEDAYLNTIATNFTPDKTSNAWAKSVTGGYIRKGSVDVTSRDVEQVESYIKNSLADGKWEAQARQLLEFQRDAYGNHMLPGEIDALIEEKKKKLIENAKTKLGFRQEDSKSDLSADSAHFQNEAIKRTVEGGQIVYETNPWTRDRVDANGQSVYKYKTPTGTTVPLTSQVIDRYTNALSSTLGEDGKPIKNFQQLYEQAYLGGAEKIKEFRKNFFAANPGMNIQELTAVMNYELGIQNLESPNVGEDDAAKNATFAATVVNAINNKNQNIPSSNIIISTQDGKMVDVTSEYSSPNDLANAKDSGGTNYVYHPVIAGQPAVIWNTAPDGTMIDKNNKIILYPSTHPTKPGQPVKSVADAKDAGKLGLLTVSTQKTSEMHMNQNPIVATVSNTKQFVETTVNTDNSVSEVKKYQVSVPYTRLNLTTNEQETVTVIVTYDVDDIGAKVPANK